VRERDSERQGRERWGKRRDGRRKKGKDGKDWKGEFRGRRGENVGAPNRCAPTSELRLHHCIVHESGCFNI